MVEGGAARQAEICPECGTPMELVDVTGDSPTEAGTPSDIASSAMGADGGGGGEGSGAGMDVVFRCANGHERRFHRAT